MINKVSYIIKRGIFVRDENGKIKTNEHGNIALKIPSGHLVAIATTGDKRWIVTTYDESKDTKQKKKRLKTTS